MFQSLWDTPSFILKILYVTVINKKWIYTSIIKHSEHRYFHDRSYFDGNDRRCIYLCPTNPLAKKERKFDCVLPVRKSHCWICEFV